MRNTLKFGAIIAIAACTLANIYAEEAVPGNEADAKAFLAKYLATGADHAALSKELRPTAADYAAVYEADFAKKLEALYTPAWDAGVLILAPKEGQTELLLASATSADLKAWNKAAQEFPGGYRQIADKLKDGVTLYRFKFVKPGETIGMAFDGLVYVNGHWRIIPKPWRAAAE